MSAQHVRVQVSVVEHFVHKRFVYLTVTFDGSLSEMFDTCSAF